MTERAEELLSTAPQAVALAAGLIVVLTGIHPSEADSQEPVPTRIAWTQIPTESANPSTSAIAETLFADRYARGSRVVIADACDIAGTLQVVSEGFTCAADPAFRFDGRRLLFAGQKSPQDPLQIWELDPEAPDPRQLTFCEADCVSPAYLPDGRIVFASLSAREYEEHGGKLSFSLYAVGPDRKAPTRLTFNPSTDFDPVVMPDGRILYGSWQHVGNHFWPRGVFCLMTVNSDGTGVWPMTGNHRGPWLKRGPAHLGDDRFGFIMAEQYRRFGAGVLVAFSINDAFAPQKQIVSPDQALIADVAALPDGTLVVSADPAGKPSSDFGLYRIEDGALRKLYDDPQFHELAPAVGLPGKRPDRRISVVDPGLEVAWLMALNCYRSDTQDREPPRPGTIRTARILQGMPLRQENGKGPIFLAIPGREDEPLVRPNSATGTIPLRILGEIPVKEDGSFYAKVPPDVPLRIQLISDDGMCMANQRAWFWLRPGERRVCIGCHENRETAPRNVLPLAGKEPPVDLTDPSRWETVSFRRYVQPRVILPKCATTDCHVPFRPTGGMNLSGDVLNGGKDAVMADLYGPAYANLIRRQEGKPYSVGGRLVHPGNARQSPLLWWLHGRVLGEQFTPSPFERPMVDVHPGPEMLDPETLELLKKWIDLGAQYDDESPVGPWPYHFEDLPTPSPRNAQRVPSAGHETRK